MNILTELTEVFNGFDIPFQMGYFGDEPPDKYVVMLPTEDVFDVFSDNLPTIDRQRATLVICNKENPYELRDKIVNELLRRNFSILSRKYEGFGVDTGHHVMAVDIEGCYNYDAKLGVGNGGD